MAAALLRGGTGLCVRCIHRELCRVVWRPHTALFSSKPSDRKQPRRTHIKKAKPQPALDVAKLLEQLFAQRRPGTAPPAGKAQPSKASSMLTKPPTSSSVKAPTSNPLLKTEPAVSVFPAASTFKQADSFPKKTASMFDTEPPAPQPTSPTNPKTSYSSETPQQSAHDFMQGFAADGVSSATVPPTSTTYASSEAAAIERQTSAETIGTNAETAGTPSFSAAAVEPLIETRPESPVEPHLSPVETLNVRAAVVEGPVKPIVEESQMKCTDSGEVVVSLAAEEQPLIQIDSPAEVSHFPMETPETRAAVVEGPVEPTIDVTVDTAAVEPLLETTVEPSVEASTSPPETLEKRDAVVEDSVETEADRAAQTNSMDSVVNVSHSAKEEPLIETEVEPAVEARAAVSEGSVENEAAESLSHVALIQNLQAPLPLKDEAESTLESSSGNVSVEERVNKSEQMTLESVTLHVVETQVESLKTDELLQTKSALDERAEQQLQESSLQTGAEHKPAAETENSSEDESEILTDSLSKWDSLSEDLHELEGESDMLVKELLCGVPAVLSKPPDTVKSASDGESLHVEENGSEAEAMTLESVTLSKVKAEVGGLETDVLVETRNALEEEAEILRKQEKMEVKITIEDVFEDTAEAEMLTLESISEATDAIEAETSVILESMFGSEQGPRQPTDTIEHQQEEVINQEAEKESGEQEGSLLEAMTVESVTLAEVEASLAALENESLNETTDYLEKEAEALAGDKRMEVEDDVETEETTEALSLPEGDGLSEALQTDALMEELLFSIPGHLTAVTEGLTGQEAARTNSLDATVAAGSVDVDPAAAETDNSPASPALKEVQLGQEVEEEGAQTEGLGSEDGKGAHTDLDPVQRLFLEKIREYNNMRRLNEGPLEVEPDYEKYLSEETAKLQRLYGGGDLSSFPEFTFTEPKMDQDS